MLDEISPAPMFTTADDESDEAAELELEDAEDSDWLIDDVTAGRTPA